MVKEMRKCEYFSETVIINERHGDKTFGHLERNTRRFFKF